MFATDNIFTFYRINLGKERGEIVYYTNQILTSSQIDFNTGKRKFYFGGELAFVIETNDSVEILKSPLLQNFTMPEDRIPKFGMPVEEYDRIYTHRVKLMPNE